MKQIFLLTLLVAATAANSQDILWEKSYGGTHADYLFDALPTADYGYILAGSSLSQKGGNKTSDNIGDLDYWVWKMDEHGELDWQKSFGGSGPDLLYSICNTLDGGFILAGTSESSISGDKKDVCKGKEDFWVIKLNAKGSEEWQCTIGGSGKEQLTSIAKTDDGGFILGGSSSSDIIVKVDDDLYSKNEKNRGSLDYWVIRLDKTGIIKWQKTFGGIYADVLESIEQTSDGGFIIGGYSNSPASHDKSHQGYGSGDFWIIKVNENGEEQWQQCLGGEDDDHLYVLNQTRDGGYIAAGNSASGATGSKSISNKEGTDFWVIKLDQYGEVLWQDVYNTGKTDVLTSLVENADGTFLIGGYAQTEVIDEKKSDKKEINDYLALKIKANGEEIWKKSVGSKGEDILRKLIETRDGGYLLAGTSKGQVSSDRNSGQGSNDFWVVKLKDKSKKDNDQRLKLEAIPNPVIEYTNIIVGFEFDYGTLSLFDLAGRQLQSFYVSEKTIPLNLGSYQDGIYVVEVKTNKGTESVKIIKGNG